MVSIPGKYLCFVLISIELAEPNIMKGEDCFVCYLPLIQVLCFINYLPCVINFWVFVRRPWPTGLHWTSWCRRAVEPQMLIFLLIFRSGWRGCRVRYKCRFVTSHTCFSTLNLKEDLMSSFWGHEHWRCPQFIGLRTTMWGRGASKLY
jgi:hypothetical protein